MANYIVSIFLSVVIATKIIALIQFLMKKYSSKIMCVWIITDKLEVLRGVKRKPAKDVIINLSKPYARYRNCNSNDKHIIQR